MTGNEHHQDGAQQRRPRADHSLSTANIDLRGVAQRRREAEDKLEKHLREQEELHPKHHEEHRDWRASGGEGS